MHIALRFSLILRAELSRYEENSRLSGVIYLHRISDNRFGGTAGRNFDMFRKLCGDAALKNVVLVTNMWSGVPPDVGNARESELSSNFFKLATNKGAQMVRHYDTAQSAHGIIRMIVAKRPVVLQIQRELVDEHKDIVNTTAGEAVRGELNEQIRRHQVELEDIRGEMTQALREKDEETVRELQGERRKLQERMEDIARDSERMVENYAAEKERMEARVKEMEQEAIRERDRAVAEYDHKLASLTGHLESTPNVPEAERVELEQEIKKLQDRITIPIYE